MPAGSTRSETVKRVAVFWKFLQIPDCPLCDFRSTKDEHRSYVFRRSQLRNNKLELSSIYANAAKGAELSDGL